ncbi:MAG: hypothetical protein ACI3YT_05065 [Prevotella sp.]
MKKIHILFAMLLISAITLISCSDNEDTTPSMADANVFAPAASDNSATAQLQRDFYKETGVYLLFSDTLTAVNGGKPELLDLGWTLSGSYGSVFSYEYIYDINSQRQAADAVKKHVLERLGSAKPFSILLANSITYKSYGKVKNQTMVLGNRCYAFNLDGGSALDDPDTFFGNLFTSMVQSILEKYSTELQAFYDISSEYYGEYIDDFGLEDPTEEELWEYGFFEYDDWWGSFYFKNTDFKQWVKKVTTMSRSEFEATYGSSATMMNKYEALVGVIEKIGIKL